MPTLDKTVIRDFRNIELQELDFCPNLNCISGGNGEGKTNLLDAIWYLAMTKSAFATGDKFNFRHGAGSFALSGDFTISGGRTTSIAVEVRDNGEKRVRRDGKQYTKISEHIGLIPIVMVSPADTALVSESGEERRKFANAVISQMDRPYLYSLQRYNHLLQQRNCLLKGGNADPGLLDALDSGLSDEAGTVRRARQDFSAGLSPLVGKYYAAISGSAEKVEVTYRSDLDGGESLKDILSRTRERDAALRYTGSGIQRDDFLFWMDGYPIRRCGSQGQQKSFLVALKFAQYELMRKNFGGEAPILLLDDLFDKLDMDRVSNLLKMVSGEDFGQIFLSDSNKVRIKSVVAGLSGSRTFCEAKGGVFSSEDE